MQYDICEVVVESLCHRVCVHYLCQPLYVISTTMNDYTGDLDNRNNSEEQAQDTGSLEGGIGEVA